MANPNLGMPSKPSTVGKKFQIHNSYMELEITKKKKKKLIRASERQPNHEILSHSEKFLIMPHPKAIPKTYVPEVG